MSTPAIYFAHPATGEFIGTGHADADPLDGNNWLTPAHAYLDAPPLAPVGYTAVRDEEHWVLVPDHRGTVYSIITGAAVLHDKLGELSDELTLDPRPSLAHTWHEGEWHFSQTLADTLLTEAKTSAWGLIKAERDRRKTGGVKIGTKWFHSDDGSRIQQMGLVMMGTNIPNGLKWKTMDGSFVDMTASLAQQVFAAVAANDQAIFATAETHRAQMEAATEPDAYDFSTGWPKIFGE